MIKFKVEKLFVRFDVIVKMGEVVWVDVVFMVLIMDIICDYLFVNDCKYLDEFDFKFLWK